jgi:hypothetical protein
MLFKIRKLPISAAAVVFSMALAACDLIDPPPPAIPPVNVADVVAPAPTPDTPPLYCKIGHGTAQFGRDWYDFADAEFELYRGQPANISLTRLHGSQQMSIRVLFDGKGQKLIFCPYLVGPGGDALDPDRRISCASLYALDDDLRDGIKRTFDIPAAVRGGAITCAYSQERLRSLKLPPAGGN